MSSRLNQNNADPIPLRPKTQEAAHHRAPGSSRALNTKRPTALPNASTTLKTHKECPPKSTTQMKASTIHKQGDRTHASAVGTNSVRPSQGIQRTHGTNSQSGSGSRAGTLPSTGTSDSTSQKVATSTPSGQVPSSGHRAGSNTQGASGGSAAATPEQLWQVVSIVVFKGEPIDAYIYRHVGLMIQTLRKDTLIKRTFLHITGASGFFAKQERQGYNPLLSYNRCGHVQVAKRRLTSETDSTLHNTVWSTPLKNDDRSWNCQNWVGDALQRCVDAGYLSRAQMDSALDGMVDILLEAPDAGI